MKKTLTPALVIIAVLLCTMSQGCSKNDAQTQENPELFGENAAMEQETEERSEKSLLQKINEGINAMNRKVDDINAAMDQFEQDYYQKVDDVMDQFEQQVNTYMEKGKGMVNSYPPPTLP